MTVGVLAVFVLSFIQKCNSGAAAANDWLALGFRDCVGVGQNAGAVGVIVHVAEQCRIGHHVRTAVQANSNCSQNIKSKNIQHEVFSDTHPPKARNFLQIHRGKEATYLGRYQDSSFRSSVDLFLSMRLEVEL